MALPLGSIGQLALGSLVSRGADRLLDPNKVKQNKFNILTGGGITGQGDSDDDKTKGPTTLGGIAKTGIMNALGFQLANAIFGPIFAPLALNLATRFVDRRKQGLGFFGQDGQDVAPEDVRGTFTATAPQFADVQDTLGSIDSGTDINYDTGDITDVATGITTGNVYDEVALTGGSGDDSGSNGGGGGSTGSMDASDFSDDTAGTPFRYGGLASLYR